MFDATTAAKSNKMLENPLEKYVCLLFPHTTCSAKIFFLPTQFPKDRAVEKEQETQKYKCGTSPP